MPHDVFVSHSTKDKEVADRVCEAMEAEGIPCWIAPRDILPGKLWAEAIIDAIDESKVMVLVLSSHANESGHIKREIERADNSKTALIPLFIEKITPSKYLDYFIKNTQWLDASTPPLEPHLHKLAQTIKTLTASGNIASTAPAPGDTFTERELPPSQPSPQPFDARATIAPHDFDAPRVSKLPAWIRAGVFGLLIVLGVSYLMSRRQAQRENRQLPTPTATATPAPTQTPLRPQNQSTPTPVPTRRRPLQQNPNINRRNLRN